VADYHTKWAGIGPHGVEIDDETDDFDMISDLARWRKYTGITS
jgi:hypothetical protein